ncbi:Rieske domain-containing protein [Cynoglossus semilaevis]|uniref:Rieske domain-containing protein n=1 Tax=Cynoglossus semilaevis TaxID=244447 RepID=UPI00049749A7|nr:Rieske domain-containing protein [Cynoglossus semilaevis]XP_016892390.1 Rieske domain-containing protein [Cynoglossus semilaevis]
MEKEQPTGGLHFVGKKDDLVAAKRSFRTLEDRDVLIVSHEGVFYALDSYCYHAGGKLDHGDIEEFDGKLCIICPKHKYKISLAKGECLSKAKDPSQDSALPRWYSKGVKQRTHLVTEINGDIYVKLSTEPGWLESDYYQGEKGKRTRAIAATDEEKSES